MLLVAAAVLKYTEALGHGRPELCAHWDLSGSWSGRVSGQLSHRGRFCRRNLRNKFKLHDAMVVVKGAERFWYVPEAPVYGAEVPRLKFNLRFAFGPGDNAFLSESRRRCALHRGEIYTMRMQQDVGPRLLCGFKRLMIDSTLRRRIRYRSRDETRRQSKPRGIIIGNVTPHMAQCALTIDREAAFRRLDGQTWFNSMH